MQATVLQECKTFHLDLHTDEDDNCRLYRRVTLRHGCAVHRVSVILHRCGSWCI